MELDRFASYCKVNVSANLAGPFCTKVNGYKVILCHCKVMEILQNTSCITVSIPVVGGCEHHFGFQRGIRLLLGDKRRGEKDKIKGRKKGEEKF